MTQIEEMLQGSPLVGGGLTLMIAGWVGYQLRALPLRLYGAVRRIATRVIEVRERSPLYEAWLGLVTDGALRRGGPRTLEVRATPSRFDEQSPSVNYAAGEESFWARVCGKLCRVSIDREASNNPHELVRRFVITVEVLFGTRADLGRMLDAAKARADTTADRQLVELCNRYGVSQSQLIPLRSPDTLCLPGELYERVASRVREFVASRVEYERVGIPWRFGILLHGAPGTGKTSLAHTLASQLGLRLAVIPLADLRSDEDLVNAFEGVCGQAIVLIEDVDCAFRQRKQADADGITFSGLLNCIDGVIAPHNGRILIMSTNHIDQLDPALIRPGRVDLRIELPLLDRATAVAYVDRLFGYMAERHALVEETLREENPTPAALINRLMQYDWRRAVDLDEAARVSNGRPMAGAARRSLRRRRGRRPRLRA